MQNEKSSFLLKLSRFTSEDFKLPVTIALVIETISNLQIIGSILKACISPTSDLNSVVSFIKDIIVGTGIFSLWDITESESLSQALWVVGAMWIAAQTFLMIALVVMIVMRIYNKYGVPKVISFLSILHSRMLFYPLHYFYLQILNLYITNNKTNNDFLSENTVVGLTLIFGILNLLFAVFKELFAYRITKTKNSYCSKNNTHSRLQLFHKIIISAIYILMNPGKEKPIIIAIISILYCFAAIFNLYLRLPFYKLKLLKYSFTLASMTLSISGIALFNSFEGGIHISETFLVVFTLLVMKIMMMHLNLSLEKLLSGELTTPERAIHYPILLKEYISNYTGLILVRRMFPLESIYLYNSFDSNLDDASNQKDLTQQKMTNQELYSKIVDKFLSCKMQYLKSEVFLLYLSRLYMKKLDNASKAIDYINKVQTLNRSIPIRNSIDSIQTSLQISYFKTFKYSEDDLELANYFTFREEFNSLKATMIKEIKHHLEFWHELSKDTIEIKKVVEYSTLIDMIYVKIRNRWRKKATRFTQVYPSSLLMYGLYLDSIRGLPSESMPMIQKFYNYNKSHGFKHKVGILDESSALVIASIEKDKMGTILDASNTVEALFSLPKERVIGGKINVLMPSFIARSHDWFMQSYSQSSITKGIDKTIETFGKTFDESLIELEIKLKLYPFLEKGVNMMAYIKQINSEQRVAILSPNGALTDFTATLQEDVSAKGFSLKNLNLIECCSEFAKINSAFNIVYGEGEERFKLRAGDTEISFVKEKDIIEEIQPTKENQNTYNFTQLDTNNDHLLQNLKTKIDDFPFITGGNPDFNDVPKKQTPVNNLTINYKDSTSLKIPTLPLPKIQSHLGEEEANGICSIFKEGDFLYLDKHASTQNKNRKILLNVKITPYIILGEVYKIMRVSNIEIIDQEPNENGEDNNSLLQKAISRYTNKGSNYEQFSWKNSSKLSQTLGLTNEDIPDERSEEIDSKKETPSEKKINLIKISVPTESGHFNTTTKQNSKNHDRIKGKGNLMQDIDIRHSLTGKGGSSTKSYSHMDLKLIKTLNDFFGEEKIRFITKVSIYGVYLIMIGVFTLAIVNYFFTQKSLTEVRNGVTIADTASTRLTSVLRAWQWVILTYTRLIGLRPASSIADQIKQSVVTETANMLELNNKLRSNLNEFGSDEIIQVILGSSVSLYDPTTQEVLTDGPIDSFTANKLLGLKNQVLGTWNGTDSDLLARAEPMTSINNTANEYLLSSETQIDSILIGLQSIIDRNKSLLQIILVIENLALVALGVSLLIVTRVVIRIYSRTFRALVRLTNKSIEERIFRIKKFQTSLNENIEAKSFVQNLNLYLTFFEDNDEKKLKDTKSKEKNMRFFSKNFRIRSLTLFIAKYLAVSFFFILVTSGIFAVLYIESIRSFDKLNAVNTQLSVTNKLSYQSSLVLSSFYFNAMYWDDDSMMIRNEGSIRQMDYNLEVFGNVNQQLLNTLFRGESGSNIVIEEFLQSNLCHYLDNEIRDNCEDATQGNLGLLGFNLKYYAISLNYVNLFKEDTSPANIESLVQSYFEAVTIDTQVLDRAYNFLTLHILEGFHDEVDTLSALNLFLSLIAIFFIVLTTVIIQLITLRKLIVLDNCQKKVFRSLTYYVFSQNKSVGFLLKKEFGDEIEGLNRILYGS